MGWLAYVFGALLERLMPNSQLSTVSTICVLGATGTMSTWTFPPRPHWSMKQMSDQTGRVALVTGGNAGIGYAICRELLLHGATVHLASPSRERGEEAINKLEKETGSRADLVILDLADLNQIKQAADSFKSSNERLDMLFCNAGTLGLPLDQLTAQGLDMSYGVMVLGHVYLTQCLLPTLKANYAATSRKPRVINVSSNAHNLPLAKIPFDTRLTSPSKHRSKLGPFPMYGHAKLGNILFANWLHRTYGDWLVSTSIHPGGTDTGFFRNIPKFAAYIARVLLLQPVQFGALTPLWAATSPETESMGGKYLIAYCRERTAGADQRAWEPEWQTKMMDWCEGQVKKAEGN